MIDKKNPRMQLLRCWSIIEMWINNLIGWTINIEDWFQKYCLWFLYIEIRLAIFYRVRTILAHISQWLIKQFSRMQLLRCWSMIEMWIDDLKGWTIIIEDLKKNIACDFYMYWNIFDNIVWYCAYSNSQSQFSQHLLWVIPA